MPSSLPIEEVIDQIKSTLIQGNDLILEAPPGAGKTTVVPISLLNENWLGNLKIIMLEPRRIAARTAAERMAELLGEKVGETVGYRVRMDTKVSARTRIEVVTEGILNRMLQEDPILSDAGLLIFDEFHERSLDGDLGLALALQGRDLLGELREQPLKLLIMSATLDGANVSALLNDAPVISSKGRSFPIEVSYHPIISNKHNYYANDRISDHVATLIIQALEEQSGSLLVFLPGQREIREVEKQLSAKLMANSGIVITPLHGNLSLSAQRSAIQPAPEGKRKVVLTTSIAETSLTIEGVRVVIDSGLSRLPEYDPKTAMARLKTERVSKAAALQRAGRAGRTQPGVCYRLWSEEQQQSLRPFTPPEIEQADLTPMALQLLHWGVNNPDELRWMTLPAAAPYQQAKDLLQQLGALEENSKALTAHGKAMAQLPMHPRLAHMLVVSLSLGWARQACQVAALLSERDPLPQSGSSDIETRLELLGGERTGSHASKALIARIQQLARQFESTLSNIGVTPSDIPKEKLAGTLKKSAVGIMIALAYPDRIALRQSQTSENYKLSNGRQATLTKNDALQRHEMLSIVQLGGSGDVGKDRIYLATPLDIEALRIVCPYHFREQLNVNWDDQNQRLIAEKQTLISKLVIERKPLRNVHEITSRFGY